MSKKKSFCNRKSTVVRKGKGLLNTIINKLPVELHIPGYNFCGPGTKLRKRLDRGDKGINPLDEACKEHDIAYAQSEDLFKRHVADEKLYKKAVERMKSKDAAVGERITSSLVAGLMKGKTKLGMGLTRRGKTRKYRRFIRKRKGRYGGALSFLKAMKKARSALGRRARVRSVLDNSKIAYRSLKRWGDKGKILPPRSRIIPIPKTGGFLPLIPLFAALGALGSLGGGAAAIAKAVNEAKEAKEKLAETVRHDRAMEANKSGGLYGKPYTGYGIPIGKGLYVKPYKAGCGIQLSQMSVPKNG